MATRFYFGESGAPAAAPAFSAGWEVTSAAARQTLTRFKPGGSQTATRSDTSTTGDQDVLAFQFVSQPLQAQTISGTIKGQFRASETSTGGDWRAQLRAYVVSRDGATVRGILLDFDGGALASEFVTTLTNRKFPLAWSGGGAAISSVGALDGDRIVIEIGARTHNAGSGVTSFSIDFRSNAASDLPEDETSTSVLNSWLELSHDVLYEIAEPGRLSGTKAVGYELGLPGQVPNDGNSSLQASDATENFVSVPAQKRGRPRAKNVVPLGSPAQIPPVGNSEGANNFSLTETFSSLATKVMRGSSTLAFAPGTGAVGGVRFMYKMRGVDSGAPAPGYVTWMADFRDYGGAQSASAQPPIVGSLVGGSVVVVAQWELS